MHDRKHRISSMLDARSLGVYVNMFVCVCVYEKEYINGATTFFPTLQHFTMWYAS